MISHQLSHCKPSFTLSLWWIDQPLSAKLVFNHPNVIFSIMLTCVKKHHQPRLDGGFHIGQLSTNVNHYKSNRHYQPSSASKMIPPISLGHALASAPFTMISYASTIIRGDHPLPSAAQAIRFNPPSRCRTPRCTVATGGNP